MDSELIAKVKVAAKRQIGMLRAEINYHASHGEATREGLDQSYLRLQQEISRARFILRHLSTCMEVSGDDPESCKEVITLQQLLESSIIERSKLYDILFGQQKKDSLKSFAQSVCDLIERGEAPSWISNVTADDLINHGQEVNRLFQLLVEGQGKTSDGIPLIDSQTLIRASERSDIFTPKQCEKLLKRSVEVDDIMLKEMERLVGRLEKEEESEQWITLCTRKPILSTSSGWSCEFCTFFNDNCSDSCGACTASKPCSKQASFLEVAKHSRNKAIVKEAQTKVMGRMKKAVVVKKTPARGTSTNTVWIWNKDVPEMIGPGGKNQRDLIAKSGATSIYAFQDRLDKDGMCPVEILGSEESFKKAVDVLEKKFTKQEPMSSQPSNRVSSLSENKQASARELIWIRNVDVPDLIGPRGQTVQGMKAETGVKSITAWQERVGRDGMCPIEIRGRPDAVKKAATAIMNMFCGVHALDTLCADGEEDPTSKPVATTDAKAAAAIHKLSGMVDASSSMSIARGVLPTMSSRGDNRVAAGKSDAASVATKTVLVQTVPSIPSCSLSQQPKEDAMILLRSMLGVSKVPSILDVLEEQDKCLSCPPCEFSAWLESVQISNLEELAEALEDDDFVSLEMKANGLKYFKRFALQKAVAASLTTTQSPKGVSRMEKQGTALSTSRPNTEPPFELICPIDHVLMITDPVLAKDGYTYERNAIEDWLKRQGDSALSPMTHEPLVDAALVPNFHIRTMARDWYHANRHQCTDS